MATFHHCKSLYKTDAVTAILPTTFGMNSNSFFFFIFTTMALQACFAVEKIGKKNLQIALDRSGGNRAELETALR